MPQALLQSQTVQWRCNKHRLCELKGGAGNLNDELDEINALARCRALVCEYIPFGTNQLINLAERLGVANRVKETYLTNLIDRAPSVVKHPSVANIHPL